MILYSNLSRHYLNVFAQGFKLSQMAPIALLEDSLKCVRVALAGRRESRNLRSDMGSLENLL